MSRQRIRLPKIEPTPEDAYFNRRSIMKMLGLGGIALGTGLPMIGRSSAVAQPLARDAERGTEIEKHPALKPGIARDEILKHYPADRNDKYPLRAEGDKLTDAQTVATYNNFYEFTTQKDLVWRIAQEKFKPDPWEIEVTGLCHKPTKFSTDDIFKKFAADLEERTYRFRCVEAWAMDVPWTGIELNGLLKAVEPKSDAKFVRFFTANRPQEMPGIPSQPWYEWPYYEGLRMDEAMNELTLLCTGMYGKPLPHQNGAPFRIICPWKYGYKSPKSIVKIELVQKQPKTFWEALQPNEYPFESNVEPKVPHPRWSQKFERVIPHNNLRETLYLNGYAEWVGKLYS